MIDFEKIRQEVAKKHNLNLEENDPLFVTVTLNRLVIEAYIQLIANHYSQANREITTSLQQQLIQSREVAGHIIKEAAHYVSNEIKQTLDPIIQDQKLNLKNHKYEIFKNIENINDEFYVNIHEISDTLKKCIIFSIVISGISLVISFFLFIIILLR